MAASGSCRSSVTVGVSIGYAEDVDEAGEMFLLAKLELWRHYRLLPLDK